MLTTSFTHAVVDAVAKIGLTPNDVSLVTCEAKHVLVDPNVERYITIGWLRSDDVVLVDSSVIKKDVDAERMTATPTQIAPQVVLRFRPDLPKGKIDYEMDGDTILAIVAENFATTVRLTDDGPWSTLWNGPLSLAGDGAVRIILPDDAPADNNHWLIGTVNPKQKWAWYTWAVDKSKYYRYFDSTFKTSP